VGAIRIVFLEQLTYKKSDRAIRSKTSAPPKEITRSDHPDSRKKILALQQTAGNQAVQRMMKSGVLQAKLRIGQPNDIYEQEADRVAEQVMRMPDPSRTLECLTVSQPAAAAIQRKCIRCKNNEYDEKKLMRKETPVSLYHPDVPPVVYDVLRSPGQPLDPATRAFFEPRFGADFGNVRIHSDSRSEKAVQSIQAMAFTVGNDIFLNREQHYSRSPTRQFLLAHELSHVIQQRAITSQPTTGYVVQRAFPWLIAAAVAALAAGGYAWWAHNCLEPVNPLMYHATFGPDLQRRNGGFRLWYFHQTQQRPVPSRVWDAFGHCYVACAATKRCGSTTTAIAGRGREIYREYIDAAPHDSYAQDVNNQALGRTYGRQNADCENACRQASLHPDVMDLTAPLAQYWTPARSDYDATPEEIRADAEILRREAQQREQRQLEQRLRGEYERCLHTELERPGGVPTEEEEAQARETCRRRTGFPN
jgi:hypothetical protein